MSAKKLESGFDFGTSTTLVASARGVVNIGRGVDWMPSLVGYGDDGTVVVGEQAAGLPDGSFVASIKRAITERRDFVRVETPTGLRDVRVDSLITPILVEAIQRGGETGQQHLERQGSVALGCPAMWDGKQRRRMLAIAQEAGLGVTLDSLVDEPVAAGMAWLANHREESGGPLRVLVFDMGGGTLDVAVLDVRGVKRQEVTVLAAVGIAEAGDDLDRALAEDLDYALASAGVDVDNLANPTRARIQLGFAARIAKIALTTESQTQLRLSPRVFGSTAIYYTREQLNAVFDAQMDRAEMVVLAALRAAKLTDPAPASAYDIARAPVEELVRSVDVVLLSGGMSQIPYVHERLAMLFHNGARIEAASANTEDAVAVGLAKAGEYGRVNMFRPAFDVLVEWDGGEYRTVYDAFTPLVESWQIIQGGSDLRYTRNGMDLSLPRQAKGTLRVVSHSGQPVRASLGGQRLDGFPVALSEQKFEFSIYPNGRIRLTDANQTYEGQLDDWHTMEGA